VIDGLDEHAAGAASRVIDALALVGIDDQAHEVDHRAGRVELAGLFIGEVGEMLDQVFVGLPQHVGSHEGPGEGVLGEMLDEVDKEPVREAILVRPLGIPEDAVEVFLIGALDRPKAGLDLQPYIGRGGPDIVPVTALRDDEAVKLGQSGIVLIALRLLQRGLIFLVIDIGDALEKEHREDVGLEI